MTRSELIYKIAEEAQAPQIEAARFMESFLSRLGSYLREGDTFILENIGSFVMKKTGGGDGHDSVPEIISFTPLDNYSGKKNELLFGIPDASLTKHNPLDDYFSLSINKTLIPVSGQPFIPPTIPSSPIELRKFLDNKAEQLIQRGHFEYNNRKAEITKNTASFTGSVSEKNFGNSAFDKKGNDISDIPSLDWEFGADWKKEFEEEELISTSTSEDITLPVEYSADAEENEFPIVDWDFGSSRKTTKAVRQTESEQKSEIISEQSAPAKDEVESPEPSSFFAPVPSITRELEIDLSELEEDEGNEENAEVPEEEHNIEDFDTIFKKSLAENVLKSPTNIVDEEDKSELVQSQGNTENLEAASESEEEQYEPNPDDPDSIAIDLRGGSYEKAKQGKLQVTGIRDRVETSGSSSSTGSMKWYIIGFILITLTGALLYIKLYGPPVWVKGYLSSEEKTGGIKQTYATIIERDYEFPVTYPYPNKTSESQNPTQLTFENLPPSSDDSKEIPAPVNVEENIGLADSKKTETNTKETTPKNPDALSAPNQRVPEQKVKREQKPAMQVKGNIFRDGDKYQVQVMSVKSKSVAETEADKLKSQGYNAFVMQVEIPGKGTWYRVRIGNFSTLEEAEKVAGKF